MPLPLVPALLSMLLCKLVCDLLVKPVIPLLYDSSVHHYPQQQQQQQGIR